MSGTRWGCPKCGEAHAQEFPEESYHGPLPVRMLRELFGNREHFDVYVCPRCGRLGFFLEGMGEEFRQH